MWSAWTGLAPRRALRSTPTVLNETQRATYHRDGYLILRGFVASDAIAVLRARAEAIVAAFDPADASVFTTTDQDRHIDRWFLDSGDAVRCFLEVGAVDPAGQLTRDKRLAVNKIGHALHDRDPVFDAFSRTAALAELASDLGLSAPLIWQSQYIFKQPGIGGEVRWHQDATFFVTEPVTVTTFWFALEEATVANGCLWAEPGGHRGPLRERFVRDGDATRTEPVDPAAWPTTATAVPLEAAAGDLVVFGGLLPHYSATNTSTASRHAYTLHVTDAAAVYAPTNWLQRRTDDPARGFRP